MVIVDDVLLLISEPHSSLALPVQISLLSSRLTFNC